MAINPIPGAVLPVFHLAGDAPHVFRQMHEREFYTTFAQATPVWEDEVEFSTQASLSSCGMDDCITVFGIERDANGSIVEISAYHIKSFTKEDEMIETYFSRFVAQDAVSFYIIGGNAASVARGDLLDTIRATIRGYFGNIDRIRQSLTGINDGRHNKYSTANIQMDGSLSYCFHGRIE